MSPPPLPSPCGSRIVLGDQGITYCPDCDDCECCAEDWEARHGHLDFECVRQIGYYDGPCIYKDNGRFPRHRCEETSPPCA